MNTDPPCTKPDSNPPPSESQMKTVLVVGDWIVDEHWVIGSERSRTASRRGDAHYHAIHAPSSTVVALCGAGLVASLLGSDKMRRFDVHGVGLWHRDDESALKCMLDPTCTHGDTPFRVARPVSSIGANLSIQLHNIGQCINGLKEDEFNATTRAIRFYNRIGDRVRLIHRLDWELYLPEDDRQTHHSEESAPPRLRRGWVSHTQQLDSAFSDIPFDSLDAIIVKDLVKGVVCDVTIDWLLSKTKNNEKARWFVSSKDWRPGWLSKLKDRDVRLLVIPQVSTQEAVRRGDINTWRVGGGRPSNTAFKLIDDVDKDLGDNHRRLIVALPKGMTVIAKSCEEPPKLILHQEETLHTDADGVPMASVLFSALTANMLCEEDRVHSDLLDSALSITDTWMVHEANRIRDPIHWESSRDSLLVESNDARLSSIRRFKPLWWNTVRSAWTQARKKHGIIDGKRLDLWRAMTDINGYVCCVETKRDVLKQLKRELIRFKDATSRKHTSIMIRANPGAGKSFLVQKAAEHLSFHLLLFNITQMISKRDLLDCFDTIVSTQAQLRGERPVLVFFDEINGRLDNSSVYDMFLAPLADGTYTKEGKTFYIQPCVWLFAGTNLDRDDKDNKGSDFADRLSIDVQDFRIRPPKTPKSEIELELVYLAVFLIRITFPDVRFITDKVLEVFAHLDRTMTVRKIRRFVASLQDVRQTVRFSSIPGKLLKEYLAPQYQEFMHGSGSETRIEIWTEPDPRYGLISDGQGAGGDNDKVR